MSRKWSADLTVVLGTDEYFMRDPLKVQHFIRKKVKAS
jgi:hypothetical protein